MTVEPLDGRAIIMRMIPVVNAGPFRRFAMGIDVPGGMDIPASAAEAAGTEPIEIDRELADTTKVAIIRIAEAAAEDKGVALEPCWRVLRVAKWARVSALRRKLEAFLDSTEEALVITEPEFKLADEILACSLQIEEGEGESLKRTLETVGIVIGIAGGIAALVTTIF